VTLCHKHVPGQYDRCVGWSEWIRGGGEMEPSLYAADFRRLGEQVDALLEAGCRVFHFDCGDGHFVPPVTIGPVVLRSIAPGIRAAGGVLDCHLMVDDPSHHLEEFAASGADSVTFHVEVARDPAAVAERARSLGLAVGVAFNPATSPARAAEAASAAGAEIVLCMSIEPGYSGQAFMPEALGRIAELATLVDVPIQVDGGVGEENVREVGRAGATLLVAGSAIFADPDPAQAYRRLASAAA
jgi:ribulose-phosphate 3-epimerase